MRGVTVVFDEDGGIDMILIPDRRVMASKQDDGVWLASVHDELGNPDWDCGHWGSSSLEGILVEVASAPIRAKLKAEWTLK